MATLAVAAMALTGCSGSAGDQADIHVSPHTSRMVQPVSTRISGLEGGQKVTVTLTSKDARGMHWSSSARFTADKDGDIDLNSDKPVKGDYHGSDGMGLMEALAPKDPSKPAYYAWRRHGKPQSFTLAVSSASGSPLAKTTFQRRFAPDVTSSAQSVGKQGFDGVYYHKVGASSGPKRPAVLAFGGSEGGNMMGILGKPLAASGFPTLTIAYFHAPGLPHDLKKIPLEYFAKALRWLRGQPGVDPHRVYIMGASRGTEAAQLVAIHYPKLVHGVILGSPTDFVHEGWTTDHGGRPLDTAAWTYRGKPVPYTSYSAGASLLGSAIPVEEIDGPLLLACGGSDEVWDSCKASHRIIKRLDRHHSPHQHVLLEYPRAGHGGGEFYPYDPLSRAGQGDRVGRTPLANQKARADSWPKLIHFLGQNDRG